MFLTKMITVFMPSVFVLATGGGLCFWSQPTSSMALQASSNQLPPPDKKAPKTDKEQLHGTWQVVELAIQGKGLEKVPDDESRKNYQAVFNGDNLTWRGFKLKYTIDPSKKPKHMDWFPENAEAKALGIYELDGDTLKVCLPNPGEDRPTEFKSVDGGPNQPEGKVKVFVFKRVKSKDEK